jgi:sulfur carrier protein ThiS
MSNIQEAMGLVNELHKDHAIKQKGGKMYLQVVHRVEAFRRTVGADLGIDTRILVDDGHRVVVKAIVTNADGITVGSGMAEEIRGQGHVNTTSALENAETSAIGRALASLGLSGGEYASANEMEAVPRKQKHLDDAKEAGTTPVQAAAVEKKDPPSQASPAPSDRISDDDLAAQNERYDKAFYLDMSSRLTQARHISKVHGLFEEMKPKIQEIKKRNPERAKHILELFMKHEDRLSKGDS